MANLRAELVLLESRTCYHLSSFFEIQGLFEISSAKIHIMVSSQMPASQREPLKPVRQDHRYRYGCSSMEVLATNQPTEMCLFDSSATTFPVAKIAFTVQNREFEELFNAKIKTVIVQLLLRPSIPSECTWTLHVLRLGFHQRQTDNPIVVHLCVAHGYLSDNAACELGEEISAAISAAQWQGEKQVFCLYSMTFGVSVC